MTEQEFLRLLHFYLACIEADDRRSLTKKLDGLHDSVVSPWDQEEPLFHTQAAQVLFGAGNGRDRRLILGGSALARSAEQFIYG